MLAAVKDRFIADSRIRNHVNLLDNTRCRVYDPQHNVYTGDEVKFASLSIVGHHKRFGRFYQPTPAIF